MANLKEKNSLRSLVDSIVRKYGPEKLILFGSQARQEADEYSDLDLIIIKDTKLPFLKRLAEFPYLPIRADIFIYTPQEFKKMQEEESPFLESALKDSKVIYEKPH